MQKDNFVEFSSALQCQTIPNVLCPQQKHFFPTGIQKPIFLHIKPFKKQKMKENCFQFFSNFFFMKVSGKSDGAENQGVVYARKMFRF